MERFFHVGMQKVGQKHEPDGYADCPVDVEISCLYNRHVLVGILPPGGRASSAPEKPTGAARAVVKIKLHHRVSYSTNEIR